jgi:hypothetical protein
MLRLTASSFGARNLATKGTQIPYCNAMQDRTATPGTTTSLSMEMRKSSCALWIMTLRMANSHMRVGGTPSKPHEWMVSNLLSPCSSTPLAMQAQSDSRGCGRLILSGFINAEDNKATEQKTEQTAPASSPGLFQHPKMGARSYTLPSGFELPTDSNSGPAGPIAVNAPAAKIRGFGTSSKDTSTVDHSSGRMSPSAARVAGKPRTQRPGKSADEATKDKGKDNKSRPTPSYQPVRQELPCDPDSEGVCAVIFSVKYPQPRIDHRTMKWFALLRRHAVRRLDLGQSTNGDEVRNSNLTFMCFTENALVGSQLSLGTPTSLPRDQVVANQLSLYSSYLALQTQHAPSAHDETIIQALKNIQDDKTKEKEEQLLPSLFDSGILQPFELGAGNELEPKTSPPMTRTTRSRTRLAAYVLPEVYEQPSDKVLGGKFSRACSSQTPAVLSNARQHGCSQDCQAAQCTREYVSRYAYRQTKNPVGRLRSPPAAVPRPAPKSVRHPS